MNSGEGTGPVYSHTIFALTNPSAKEAFCVHNPSRYHRPILNQQLCGSNKSRQNSQVFKVLLGNVVNQQGWGGRMRENELLHGPVKDSPVTFVSNLIEYF